MNSLAYSQDTAFLCLNPGSWNTFAIEVQGQHHTVKLNGMLVSDCIHPHATREIKSTAKQPTCIGLQADPDKHVPFRNTRIS